MYETAPFLFGHNVTADRWFSPERLLDLAQALPEASIEYNSGELAPCQAVETIPGNGLSLADTIRNIGSCRSWVLLKSVEQHPDFAELQRRCLDEIGHALGLRTRAMLSPRCFIFLASPQSVTPFHIDPEHNFLLQIQGAKKIQIFDRHDRSVLTEARLRAFAAGAHRNIPFRPEFDARGEWFEIAPGDGVYIPFLAPHWVVNAASVSVSFSVSLETAQTKRTLSLYRQSPCKQGS